MTLTSSLSSKSPNLEPHAPSLSVPYRACFIGASFETGNQGVSALAASLTKLVLHFNPDARVSFVAGARQPATVTLQLAHRAISVDVVNYRLSPKAKLVEHMLWLPFAALMHRLLPVRPIREFILKAHPVLHELYRADFIGDIRGGDSFSDIYGIKRLITGSLPVLVAILLGRQFVLLPQTYGPYRSGASRRIARFIMKRALLILSRDKDGVDVVEDVTGPNSQKHATVCPDVAFLLDIVRPEQLEPELALLPRTDSPLVGININGLLYNGGYSRNNMFRLKMDYKAFCYELAKAFMTKSNCRLLLISHTYVGKGHVESDWDACEDVRRRLGTMYEDRICVASYRYNQSEVKYVIGMCDFVVGARMHACIAGLSQGIPTVGIAYSRKFKGVFESIVASSLVLDARVMDTLEGVATVMELFSKRDSLHLSLKRNVDEARYRVIDCFSTILEAQPR